MNENKPTKKNVGLRRAFWGTISFILLVCLVVPFAYYIPMVNDRDNTIRNLQQQISKLNQNLTRETDILNQVVNFTISSSGSWESGMSISRIPGAHSDNMLIPVTNTGAYPGGFILKITTNPATSAGTFGGQTAPNSVYSPVIYPGNTSIVPISVVNLGTSQDTVVRITVSLYNENNEPQNSATILMCVLMSGSQ